MDDYLLPHLRQHAPWCVRRLCCLIAAYHLTCWPLPPCVLGAVELTEYSKELRYFCQACPYVYSIEKKVGAQPGIFQHLMAEWGCPVCVQITKKVTLQKKQVDDVLGGDDAWKNVAKADGALYRSGVWGCHGLLRWKWGLEAYDALPSSHRSPQSPQPRSWPTHPES